jgi:hypothetical protein
MRPPARPKHWTVERRIADLVIALADLLSEVGERLRISKSLVLPGDQSGHVLHGRCLAKQPRS